MKEYTFQTDVEKDSKAYKKAIKESQDKKLKKAKELKEATFTILTVDAAQQAVPEIMGYVGMKKNITAGSEILASMVLTGIDRFIDNEVTDPSHKVAKANRLKRYLLSIIRASMKEDI